MVDWEDIEEVLIEMAEDCKASASSWEEMLMAYVEAVDEFLSELELSKQDYGHAIQIAKRYNYRPELSHEIGHEDETEHAAMGD